MDEFKNATITGHFEFAVEDAIFSEMLHFQKGFCPHENEKPVFFKFLRFEERYHISSVFVTEKTVFDK